MTHGVEHPYCDGIKIETCWIVRYGQDGAAWARLRFMEQLAELKTRCTRGVKGGDW